MRALIPCASQCDIGNLVIRAEQVAWSTGLLGQSCKGVLTTDLIGPVTRFVSPFGNAVRLGILVWFTVESCFTWHQEMFVVQGRF